MKQKRYYKSEEINTKNHFLVDSTWPVRGSRGNEYDVKMHDKGFTCDCLGFTYNGRCKHTKEVISLLTYEEYPKYAI